MKDSVRVKVFVTKTNRFRAQIDERSIGGRRYEVTVGGTQWRMGVGLPYERRILNRCKCILEALKEGIY